MKAKILLICAAVVLVIVLVIGGCAPKPAPGPRVLEAVGQMGGDFIAAAGYQMHADAVADYSNGQLTIEIMGAGEVIPSGEQIHALQEGLIDVLYTSGDGIAAAVPLGRAMGLTNMTPWEEREAGIWDFYRQVLADQANAYWLGHHCAPQWWVLASNVPAKNPGELKGLKIRCGPSWFGAVEAIDAVPLSVPFGEIYTSMERGVVDAFLFPPSGWLQFGWAEVTDYVVGPEILHGQNSCPLVNLDVWNSLSKEEQKWLTQPFIDYERQWYDFWYEVFGGPEYGAEAMKNAGLEFIEWSDADSKQFQKTFFDETWKYATGQMSPEVVAKFAKLIGR